MRYLIHLFHDGPFARNFQTFYPAISSRVRLVACKMEKLPSALLPIRRMANCWIYAAMIVLIEVVELAKRRKAEYEK